MRNFSISSANFPSHCIFIAYDHENMDKITIDDFLLYKFFLDETSPEENAAVKGWAMSSKENACRFKRAFEQYSATTMALARLQKYPETILKDRRYKPKRRSGRGRRVALWASSVAAALVLGAFVQHYTESRHADELLSQEMTISAVPGHQSELILPDGTKVRLAGGSSLSYPLIFRDKRHVSLEGEALFNVTKDQEHPFVVSTFSHDISVKGTTFDAIADESKGYFSLALVEGNVELSDKGGQKVFDMYAGDVAVIDNEGARLVHDDEAVDESTLWTKGVISCGGKSFDEIMKLFEKRFGVHIVIERDTLPEKDIQRMKVWEPDGIESAFKVLQKAGLEFTYSFSPEENTYYIR